MAAKDLFSLVGLALGIASSLFFAKGMLGLRRDAMVELASGFYGPNPHILESLQEQRAQYVVGAVLLLLSFILQFVGPLLPTQFANRELGNKATAAGLSLGVAFAFGMVGNFGERWLARAAKSDPTRTTDA